MSQRYSLKTKINALNEVDEHDGDVAGVGEFLEIPPSTLRRWLQDEGNLRRQFRQKQRRQHERNARDLQFEMLERCQSILTGLDAETLAKAPLNQLAAALGSLVSNALKLEEVIEEIDDEEEKVVRFEFYYDGQVQDAPPWSSHSAGTPSAVQGGRLRAALGHDRTGQNGAAAEDRSGQETRLVAGADSDDGEPSLARFESERTKLAGQQH